MPTINVNDINMYYEVHGEGFPFIMIMGLAADVHWWIPEVLDSHSRNFKTIIFDNRGAGRTDKPEIPYSIKMMADDTVGLMDALNIKKAHILGASMGGMIAQEIAINYPQKVKRLVLCCTHCGGSKQILPSEEILQQMMTPRELTSEELVNEIIPLCFTEDFIKNNSEFIESFKQKMLLTPIPLDSYRRQVQSIMNFNTGIRLKKIIAPTLIIQGKKDILVPPENAEVLSRKIPDAKLVILEDAAHILFQPNPDIVIDATHDFLIEKID